jgi:DNA-directed RNA polymerase I subunit RPA43
MYLGLPGCGRGSPARIVIPYHNDCTHPVTSYEPNQYRPTQEEAGPNPTFGRKVQPASERRFPNISMITEISQMQEANQKPRNCERSLRIWQVGETKRVLERGLFEYLRALLAAASKLILRPQVNCTIEWQNLGKKQLAIRMSIQTLQQIRSSEMESPSLKHKSEKKHKSKEGKKRKRDHEDGEDSRRHKSKKHRKHKSKEESQPNSATRDSGNALSSPFHIQTASIYLPLAPISQRQPLEGMCAEHLSPLILTYYPPLGGVILSYSNPRMSEQPFEDDGNNILLQCVDEYGAAFAWTTAEFLLFKPQRGGWLEGYINLQNEGHLGLVCWNLFNASIERQRLPKDWKWVGLEGPAKANEAFTGKGQYAEDGMGYFVDGQGNKIEGTIKFRVKDIESSHDRERGFLSIEGTMLEDAAEKEVLERDLLSRLNSKGLAGRRLGGSKALGATSLGVPPEDDTDVEGGLLKHRRKY